MDNCKDTWTNPSDCEVWAEHQHCVINPSFMLKSCAKSCRSCTAGMYLLSIDLIYSVTNYKITHAKHIPRRVAHVEQEVYLSFRSTRVDPRFIVKFVLRDL